MSYLSNIHPKTGKKILYDPSDYAPSGVKAVDTVARIVGYFRKLLLDNKKHDLPFFSLKEIFLKDPMYNEFMGFCIKKAGEMAVYETLAQGIPFTFDDVDILPAKKTFWKEKNMDFKCTFYPSSQEPKEYEDLLLKLGLKQEEGGLAKYY
jgi:hypothetical protein